MNIKQAADEWLKQADYDLETAQAMLDSGRNIYCVFMCHLSIEKMLKGIFHRSSGDIPPKIHRLLYFLEEIPLKLSLPLRDFLEEMDGVSIPTRYPENLAQLLQVYDKKRTRMILSKTRQVHRCLKEKYKRLPDS